MHLCFLDQEEGGEAEAATLLMPQGGVLEVVVPAEAVTRTVVTTTEGEAMANISVAHDKRLVLELLNPQNISKE